LSWPIVSRNSVVAIVNTPGSDVYLLCRGHPPEVLIPPAGF
jgi:hypothetical protein